MSDEKLLIHHDSYPVVHKIGSLITGKQYVVTHSYQNWKPFAGNYWYLTYKLPFTHFINTEFDSSNMSRILLRHHGPEKMLRKAFPDFDVIYGGRFQILQRRVEPLPDVGIDFAEHTLIFADKVQDLGNDALAERIRKAVYNRDALELCRIANYDYIGERKLGVRMRGNPGVYVDWSKILTLYYRGSQCPDVPEHVRVVRYES